MRTMWRSLSLVVVLSSLPALAWAQDAGAPDAGEPDAAAPEDAGPVPDASAPDESGERCLDGYERSHIDACANRQAGASCTFPGGEGGQCALLRCTAADGSPLHLCVATTGQPAPPAVDADGGVIERGDGGSTQEGDASSLQGGGCNGVGLEPSALPLLAAFALLRRRAR